MTEDRSTEEQIAALKEPRTAERVVTLTYDDVVGDISGPQYVHDIGPSAEDGRVWVWSEDRPIAGPFETVAAGLVWMKGFHPAGLPDTFICTKGFEWTKRPTRAQLKSK